jgi:uncharacterized SAM-binding protein YcdF (DUF218 family)
MKKEIIIVLGSPNAPNGALGIIAQSRLDYCAETYSEGSLVLCTGGWGPHFNTSDKPHAYYAKHYLIQKGIPASCFLDLALSANTVDDAVKVKEITAKLPNANLTVITSDFHIERVNLIFLQILTEASMTFVGVESSLPEDVLKEIVAHEKVAIASLVRNGLSY